MPISNDNTNIFQKGSCVIAGTYVAKRMSEIVREHNPLLEPAFNTLNNISNVSKKQADVFINSMLNNPVLKKSNFKAVAVTNKNAEELTDSLIENAFKQTKLDEVFKTQEIKKISSNFLKPKLTKLFDLVKNGQNAFYHPLVNTAYYPKDKPFFLAHEIGHAINANTGKFAFNFIAASRILPPVIALTIPAVAIWKSYGNKNPDEKGFIQKHAGKIVGASFIPMIAEEAVASLRAIKAAKVSNLSKDIIKSMRKGYGLALSSYITFAAASALSTALATKLFSKNDKA